MRHLHSIITPALIAVTALSAAALDPSWQASGNVKEIMLTVDRDGEFGWVSTTYRFEFDANGQLAKAYIDQNEACEVKTTPEGAVKLLDFTEPVDETGEMGDKLAFSYNGSELDKCVYTYVDAEENIVTTINPADYKGPLPQTAKVERATYSLSVDTASLISAKIKYEKFDPKGNWINASWIDTDNGATAYRFIRRIAYR